MMGWFFSGLVFATVFLMVWEVTDHPHYLFASGFMTGISILILMIVVKSETP